MKNYRLFYLLIIMVIAAPKLGLGQNTMSLQVFLLKDGSAVDTSAAPFKFDLIDEGYHVSSFNVRDEFHIALNQNTVYQLVLSYPGCQPKRIQINTHTNQDNPSYNCRVDLHTSDNQAPQYAGEIFYDKVHSKFDCHLVNKSAKD